MSRDFDSIANKIAVATILIVPLWLLFGFFFWRQD